jgi:hypothetical protein
MTDEQIIKSAMSAAPEAIAKGATIIDVGSDGKIRVVRKGSNQFTCMADNPNTPGPDPMCADRNAMEWVEAWLNKKEPPKNKVGFMYMLAETQVILILMRRNPRRITIGLRPAPMS